jgi:hypothetical protein
MNLISLPRAFKIGATEYKDPYPNGTLDDCHEHFSQSFPQLRHTKLFESDGVINESMTKEIFTFQMLPPKTNG